MQDFFNNLSKILFVLDSKGDYLKQKYGQFSPCWNNTIRKDMKSTNLRKADSYHKLPTLKINDLHGVMRKMMSYEDTSAIEIFSLTGVYSTLNTILSDWMLFTNKASTCNNDEQIRRSKEHNFATVTDETKPWPILFSPKKIRHNILFEPLCTKLDEVKWKHLLWWKSLAERV